MRYHYWAPLKSREGEGKPSKGGNGKARRRRRFKKDVRRPQESNTVPQDTEETHVIFALVKMIRHVIRMIERSKRRTRRKFHRASRNDRVGEVYYRVFQVGYFRL